MQGRVLLPEMGWKWGGAWRRPVPRRARVRAHRTPSPDLCHLPLALRAPRRSPAWGRSTAQQREVSTLCLVPLQGRAATSLRRWDRNGEMLWEGETSPIYMSDWGKGLMRPEKAQGIGAIGWGAGPGVLELCMERLECQDRAVGCTISHTGLLVL